MREFYALSSSVQQPSEPLPEHFMHPDYTEGVQQVSTDLSYCFRTLPLAVNILKPSVSIMRHLVDFNGDVRTNLSMVKYQWRIKSPVLFLEKEILPYIKRDDNAMVEDEPGQSSLATGGGQIESTSQVEMKKENVQSDSSWESVHSNSNNDALLLTKEAKENTEVKEEKMDTVPALPSELQDKKPIHTPHLDSAETSSPVFEPSKPFKKTNSPNKRSPFKQKFKEIPLFPAEHSSSKQPEPQNVKEESQNNPLDDLKIQFMSREQTLSHQPKKNNRKNKQKQKQAVNSNEKQSAKPQNESWNQKKKFQNDHEKKTIQQANQNVQKEEVFCNNPLSFQNTQPSSSSYKPNFKKNKIRNTNWRKNENQTQSQSHNQNQDQNLNQSQTIINTQTQNQNQPSNQYQDQIHQEFHKKVALEDWTARPEVDALCEMDSKKKNKLKKKQEQYEKRMQMNQYKTIEGQVFANKRPLAKGFDTHSDAVNNGELMDGGWHDYKETEKPVEKKELTVNTTPLQPVINEEKKPLSASIFWRSSEQQEATPEVAPEEKVERPKPFLPEIRIRFTIKSRSVKFFPNTNIQNTNKSRHLYFSPYSQLKCLVLTIHLTPTDFHELAGIYIETFLGLLERIGIFLANTVPLVFVYVPLRGDKDNHQALLCPPYYQRPNQPTFSTWQTTDEELKVDSLEDYQHCFLMHPQWKPFLLDNKTPSYYYAPDWEKLSQSNVFYHDEIEQQPEDQEADDGLFDLPLDLVENLDFDGGYGLDD